MGEPRHIDDGPPSFDQSEKYCTCCGRQLKGKCAWLELDQRTNTYHDNGDVPPDQSQGWFPFGIACARKKLRAQGRSP